jgi:hypothetical protein
MPQRTSRPARAKLCASVAFVVIASGVMATAWVPPGRHVISRALRPPARDRVSNALPTAMRYEATSASSALTNGDVVLWAADATRVVGSWTKASSRWAAGGYKMYNTNAGASTTTAASSPASYFELSFNPRAGKDYRIWLRSAADNDDFTNDSVWLQFNNSVIGGQPIYRIGSTSGLDYALQNCSGAPIAGPGWSDAGGFGSCVPGTGTLIRFDTAITPTRIRVQQREDGIQIDQIVIAAAETRIPGNLTNDSTAAYARNAADRYGSYVSPNAACGGCRSLQIVAHADDDLLFMNPDLAGIVRYASAARTVVLSAGDAGLGSTYWRGREAGLRAAYARMAGAGNAWTVASKNLSGKILAKFTLTADPRVTLIFLRLPDGASGGTGFASTAYLSLRKLWNRTAPMLSSVDGTNQFTQGELVRTLAAIINDFAPTHLHVQDYNNLTYGSTWTDHADHVFGSQFATSARTLYGGAHYFKLYRGDNIRIEPQNLTYAAQAAKWDIFETYAAYDPKICLSCIENDATNVYWVWTFRQYPIAR